MVSRRSDAILDNRYCYQTRLHFAASYFFWQFHHLQSSAKQSSIKQSRHQRRQPTTKRQNKLLRLLSGDRAAAMRLVERLKQRHPGKSEEWYWEKAIEDLERDRR
ncbi:hypothetical protein [Coleofasciculus sp. FACHB-SPT9]|uniref:hypothetical protein n=1 Tax=Cyanophyceae TaxID=3028117 RepID=UPI001689EA31|nr:hypothetical protein [Coleofasciculus sp. FACHB-SPT9]MBD1890025.1 hypothetical protein [Coleofasciculus sp. FACHB-SPT9]